jgi:hypothetical protein
MLPFQMLRVEVFKTDVQEDGQAKALIASLSEFLPGCSINFDLDDCDRILRVEGETVVACEIERIVLQNGFECKCLE